MWPVTGQVRDVHTQTDRYESLLHTGLAGILALS
jgi:hypothetical protein